LAECREVHFNAGGELRSGGRPRAKTTIAIRLAVQDGSGATQQTRSPALLGGVPELPRLGGRLARQIGRQLGDVPGNAPRLVAREQFVCRTPLIMVHEDILFDSRENSELMSVRYASSFIRRHLPFEARLSRARASQCKHLSRLARGRLHALVADLLGRVRLIAERAD